MRRAVTVAQSDFDREEALGSAVVVVVEAAAVVVLDPADALVGAETVAWLLLQATQMTARAKPHERMDRRLTRS